MMPRLPVIPFLVLLACAAPGALAKDCQNNWVYLSFYDESGQALSLKHAGSLAGFDATSGQSCGKHMVRGADWCVDHESGNTCNEIPFNSGENVVAAFYYSGRSKSTDMGTMFRSVTNNNPLFGLGLSEDQTEGSYSPDEINLWIGINLPNIDIGNGRLLSIPSITLGQGSETSGIKALFDVIKDAGETIYDAYEGELEDSLKSFNSLVGSAMDLKYENNWYVSQPDANVYMTTYKGNPGLVIRGSDQYGNSYPVVIQNGGNDYNFTAYVITGTAASSDLSGSPHIGRNHFFHPSVGLFERESGGEWIRSLQLGRLYLLNLPKLSGQELQWMYSEESASWILWNPLTPGLIYHSLTNRIHQYDPQTLRFVKRPDLDLSVLIPPR